MDGVRRPGRQRGNRYERGERASVAEDEVEHAEVLAAEHVSMPAPPVRVAVQDGRRRRAAGTTVGP